MDIIERLDAAIKTEDFWVGDQREDNILKNAKKVIEEQRKTLILIADNTKCSYAKMMATVSLINWSNPDAVKEKE
jgi:hypothetical protein